MTKTEAKLEAGSLAKEGSSTGGSRAEPVSPQTSPLLMRALPLCDSQVETSVFAAAFVRSLEKLTPEAAYLRALEVLADFRRMDRSYRGGHLVQSR